MWFTDKSNPDVSLFYDNVEIDLLIYLYVITSGVASNCYQHMVQRHHTQQSS